MTKFYRFLATTTSVLLILILLAAGSAAWLFYTSMPSYRGHAALPGLTAKVSVYRDEHGVPHIFAGNMTDALEALGYIHAGERFFQMEMNRRAGQGRLSEAVGADTLGIDKFIRTLGLYALAQSSFTALSPEAQAQLEAYADGVNAWLAAHKHGLPPEFTLLGIKPEPWTPADSLVWGKLMALQLSHNYKLEVLRAQLSEKLSPPEMQSLFPPYGDAPVTLEPHTTQKTENHSYSPAIEAHDAITAAMNQLGRITGLDHAASNEWVIAGALTESGKPILANDPHLSLEAPILWYLARIVTPEMSVKGATVPGLPVVLLGQNDKIAWGMTTTGSDVQDLFIETPDENDAQRYKVPGGTEAFTTHTEIIHVKHQPDVTLQVRATRHGPVLSDIDPELAKLAGEGKLMALAFTGLGEHDATAEALMRINRAGNWQDFLKALELYQAPPQNVVYADIYGNIGYINPGLVPVRKSGDGLMPADGASGDYDWTGTLPFEALPQIYNPPAGFIFNANNEVAALDPARYLGVDWEEPYRAERLQQLFDTIGKHSLDTSAAMQADITSLAAKLLLPYLLAQQPADARAKAALDLLRVWNGAMDKDRAEPLIFDVWLYQMHRLLLADRARQSLNEKGPYAAAAIAYILSHEDNGWCTPADCTAIVGLALKEAISMLTQRDGDDMSKWRWGNEHITLLKNKVFSHVPLLKNLTDLSVASSGDFYTLNRGGGFSHDDAHPFGRTHGGGYRGLYDLADPARSRFMITTGESGHVFSAHYGDLVPLWNDVKSFTLTGTADELAARNMPELILEPAAR